MFLETIRSEGLAHLSYILGDGSAAAVIDPRRDCQIYLDIARNERAHITHIFETHRNEDYVTGSRELARRTGAAIYHGQALDFQFGQGVQEGKRFTLGSAELEILETPGHTDESISLVLRDRAFGNVPIAVFTGDALFIGDVGRTDFFPDRAEEVAGLLYDSIFNKLLPLGDQTLLMPAHGSGSVCGSGIASREFSTLGSERQQNAALQVEDKSAFVQKKVNEHHYYPPYFKAMEAYNIKGNDPEMPLLPHPPAMTPDQFAEAAKKGMQVVDIRSPEAFAGACIPGSLAIPLNMLPAFAGWLLRYDKPIGLVPAYEAEDTVAEAVRYLVRLGFDNIAGFLAGGLHTWETSARKYERIPALYAGELNERIEKKTDFTLLDVRSKDEFEAGHLPNALHIYVGELPDRIGEVPRKEQPITTFCGSGRRAIIAASILKQNGFSQVEDCLGSMDACTAYGCPIVND